MTSLNSFPKGFHEVMRSDPVVATKAERGKAHTQIFIKKGGVLQVTKADQKDHTVEGTTFSGPIFYASGKEVPRGTKIRFGRGSLELPSFKRLKRRTLGNARRRSNQTRRK